MTAPARPAIDDWKIDGPRLLWGLVLVSASVIAVKNLKFLQPDLSVLGPLFGPKYLQHWPVVLAHGAAAITALTLLPWALLGPLRKSWPAAHRWLGRVVLLCVAVAAPTGFLMGMDAFGGPVTKAVFCLLASLWLFTGWRGWRAARARRYAEHGRWMLRLAALTMGAVFLRVILNALHTLFGTEFEAMYQPVVLVAWALPCAGVEGWLAWKGRRGRALRRTTGTAAMEPMQLSPGPAPHRPV